MFKYAFHEISVVCIATVLKIKKIGCCVVILNEDEIYMKE